MKTYAQVMYRLMFLDLGTTITVGGQLHALAALTLRKELPVTTRHEVGCTLEPVWIICRNKQFLNSPGIKLQPLGCPGCSQSLFFATRLLAIMNCRK
jgi:hypothetical protein